MHTRKIEKKIDFIEINYANIGGGGRVGEPIKNSTYNVIEHLANTLWAKGHGKAFKKSGNGKIRCSKKIVIKKGRGMEIFFVEFKDKETRILYKYVFIWKHKYFLCSWNTRFFFSQFEIGYKVDLSLSTHTRIKIESWRTIINF